MAIEVKPQRQPAQRGEPSMNPAASNSMRLIQRAFDVLSGDAQAELQRAFASRQDIGLIELGKLRDQPVLVRAGELFAVLEADERTLERASALQPAALEQLQALVDAAELHVGAYCLEFEAAPGGADAMRSRRGGT